MTVRFTESQLPTALGIKPEDLGQVGQLENWPLPQSPDCYLISYLSSPLTQGSSNTYVIFVIDETLQKDADSYRFEVTENPRPPLQPSSYQYKAEDKVGVFNYAHPNNTPIFVTVSILDKTGTVIRKMTLMQDVSAPNPVIERLFTHSSIGFNKPSFEWHFDVGGAKETTREVANDFRAYIKEAFDLDASDKKIPMMFLAAMIYLQAFKVPKEATTDLAFENNFRQPELENTAKELNGEGGALFPSLSLGVCQISLQTLAMITPAPPPANTTLIEWKDLPTKEDERAKARYDILEKYNQLPPETKRDLFNILRFPKSNIRACFKLLEYLKNRPHRYPNMPTNDFLKDETAIQIIGTEFGIGGTLTPLNEAKPGEYGKKVLPIMHSPYLGIIFDGQYELKIAGKVIDQDTRGPIKGASVYLWRTQLDIIADTKGYILPSDKSTSIELKMGEKNMAVLQVLRNPPANPKSTFVKVRKFNPKLPDNECWVLTKSGNNLHARLYSLRSEMATTGDNGDFDFIVPSYQPHKLQIVKAPIGNNGYFDGEETTEIEPGFPPGWFLPPRENVEIKMEPAKYMIQESVFLSLLPAWRGYQYPVDRKVDDRPHFPPNYYVPQIVPINNLAPINQISCNSFVEALVVQSWHTNYPDYTWGLDQHNYAMMTAEYYPIDHFLSTRVYVQRFIWVLNNPANGTHFQIQFDGINIDVVAGASKAATAENIAAALRGNVTINAEVDIVHEPVGSTFIVLSSITARECDYPIVFNPAANFRVLTPIFATVQKTLAPNELPPHWSVVQGSRGVGGHNFFIVDVHPTTKRILTLETNKAFAMDGPGLRRLGDIDTDTVNLADYPDEENSGPVFVDGANNIKITPNKDEHWVQKVEYSWDASIPNFNIPNDYPDGVVLTRLKLYNLNWSHPIL